MSISLASVAQFPGSIRLYFFCVCGLLALYSQWSCKDSLQIVQIYTQRPVSSNLQHIHLLTSLWVSFLHETSAIKLVLGTQCFLRKSARSLFIFQVVSRVHTSPLASCTLSFTQKDIAFLLPSFGPQPISLKAFLNRLHRLLSSGSSKWKSSGFPFEIHYTLWGGWPAFIHQECVAILSSLFFHLIVSMELFLVLKHPLVVHRTVWSDLKVFYSGKKKLNWVPQSWKESHLHDLILPSL